MAEGLDLQPQDGPGPDIMNDPQFATNTDGDDGMGDADTCRICRGEGADAEPLFHPCKCSGSIKYVHQDCLMEWLSHSQKKHCELCKTPFRFTKLYSPNMPQSLPFGVLGQHLILHTIKNIWTWLRFCLVVAVWLACLPYIIRQVWRLLFWFSDGAWPPNYLAIEAAKNSTAKQALELALELQLATLTGNGTSPVTPFHASQTTPASLSGVIEKLMEYLTPLSQTSNISGSDPLTAGFFNFLYNSFGIQNVVLPAVDVSNASISRHPGNLSPRSQNSTLLSEISFLKNLTRNSYINQLVIIVAEGYVITILVVVCFILVFLIREWVVQQQPGINMGAGFNAEFAAADRGDPPNDDQGNHPVVAADDPVEPRDIGQRPIARPRRRNMNFGDGDDGLPRQPRNNVALAQDTQADAGGQTAQNRPSPVRDALSPAAEIQRRLTEERRQEPRMTEEFMAIWRRADSDPQEALRIIERENMGDQMPYWVNAMKILIGSPPREPGSRRLPMSSPSALSRANPMLNANDRTSVGGKRTRSEDTDSLRAQPDSDSASSESWVDIPEPFRVREQNIIHNDATSLSTKSCRNDDTSSLDKGKEKATEEDQEYTSNSNIEPARDSARPTSVPGTSKAPLIFGAGGHFHSSITRPRAVSDGPQLRDSLSPLAYNNWSFSNLSDDGNKVSQTVPIDQENRNENAKPIEAPDYYSPTDPTFPPRLSKSQNQEIQAWKAAQDLRVQQAVEQGKRNRKAALKGLVNGPPLPKDILDMMEGPFQVQSQDGTLRDYQNWDEVFENNPTQEPDSGDELDERVEVPEPNLIDPETPLPEVRELVVVRPAEPRGLLGNVAEFLWGGVGDNMRPDEQGGNDEHIVQDLAAEAPFVPVIHHGAFEQGREPVQQNRGAVEAAIAGGLDPNDPDAIDDAEDFEGIMELIGMRGSIFSLFQNAIFSAFLLSLTVAFGVWIPYNIGRVCVLLIANPGPAFKLPLRLVFACAAFVQDLALSFLGVVFYCLVTLPLLPLRIWSYWAPTNLATKTANIGSTALHASQDALDRILEGTATGLYHATDSDIFAFSAASHESLLSLKSLLVDTLTSIGSTVIHLVTGGNMVSLDGIWAVFTKSILYGWHLVTQIPALLRKPDSWVISLEVAKRTTPLDLTLSVWDGTDRFWAILAGYTTLCILGVLYVRKGTPFSTSHVGREWEATIIDLLNQAGGVMKVILIISIEMLAFPLYCGLLLDAALLPLFDNATITSRLLFTIKSPLTSVFVHWFVGTCYMFHFALFVSMCRKIMRKGVLYFIRDPDDPTFHPVRDVLERNVATQLRKILFSALVYGALVVICLGGVVWGLSFAFGGILPIHWSSNEPVLEFPIDLLFYNFLMPLAVKFFKPSDVLHAMYAWWFRQCARMLRLTWFLFDERKMDEEGYTVRRSWRDVFRGAKGDPMTMVKTDDINHPFIENPDLDAYFRQDGRYVRAPASDQVRIPKGTQIFLQVDEFNYRVDGKWDQPEGVHGHSSDLYKMLYIPPWFRLRIFVFILSIWIFAALTGVSITVIPLVFGRLVFAKIIPSHVRKNDVYAFSIGTYILGSALYVVINARKFATHLRNTLSINAETPHHVLRRAASAVSLVARIAWTYTAFIFVLPTLFAFLVEFYFIVPLHCYFASEERHVVHFVQSWTLGLLYVKLTTRIILWYEDSRPAQSLRAITRNGYLNPDAKLATRSFIFPAGTLLSIALLTPWLLAKIATMTFWKESTKDHVLAYRYSYPMCLALGCAVFALHSVLGLLRQWRMTIRDEVYLIGERLHNFGDRKSAVVGAKGLRRINT